VSGFSNPAYDRLVDEAAVEGDPARRASLYVRAQDLALGQGAWIGIGQAVGSYLIRGGVHGLTATANGLGPRNGDWSRVWISG
jgi:ABC-type transport system substrate-binding protein